MKANRLMTHQIIGYPDLATNEGAIALFAKHRVEFVELQIPFSEPIADGPAFLKSNQVALDRGMKVEGCLTFIEEMAEKYPVKFLIMTYYNIVLQYGVDRFLDRCQAMGLYGLIVPDAPIDDAREFFEKSRERGLQAIGIATVFSDDERLRETAAIGGDFIYYVPRKGVTGTKTAFEEELLAGIRHGKEVTEKPIAVGFGIQSVADVKSLEGVADIVVIGTKIQLLIEEQGLEGLDTFLKEISL